MGWGDNGRFFFPVARDLVGNEDSDIWIREPDRSVALVLFRDAHANDSAEVSVSYAMLKRRTRYRMGSRWVEFGEDALRGCLRRLDEADVIRLPLKIDRARQGARRGAFDVTLVNYERYRLRVIQSTTPRTTPSKNTTPTATPAATAAATPRTTPTGDLSGASSIGSNSHTADRTTPRATPTPTHTTDGVRPCIERESLDTPPYPPSGGAGFVGRKARKARVNDASEWQPPEERMGATG